MDAEVRIDVDRAWERFRQRVKDEPVPPVWSTFEAQLRQTVDMHEAGKTHLDLPRGNEGMNASPEQSSASPQVIPQSHRNTPELQPVRTAVTPGIQHQDARHASMRRIGRRRWRLGAVGAAVVLCAAGLFGSPLGEQAIAAAMHTFYVQHLQTISAADVQAVLNNLEYNRENHQSYDLKQYGTIQVATSEQPSAPPATLNETAKRSGYRIPPLPGVPQGDIAVNYSPEAHVTLRLHVDAINRLIWQLGGNTGLPANADGVPIVLTLPPQVRLYAMDPQHSGESLSVMRVPSVQVPQDVDLEQVRQALTGLPFLPDDVRRSLQGPDWTHTIYVPADKYTRTVKVGGTDVLVRSNNGLRTALWLSNGYMFQLSGSAKAFPTESDLLSAVQEILA
jgi:hypothetical protein